MRALTTARCWDGYNGAAVAGVRAGILTSGAERGASIFKLMEFSRHRSVETLRSYVRRADLFRDHAGAESSAPRLSQLTLPEPKPLNSRVRQDAKRYCPK